MKIGVLSDTHMRGPDKVLDYMLDDIFQDTDMILHAGDIVTSRVLDILEERKAIAVCGNMDDLVIAGTLPQVRVVKVQNARIGLIHGWGSKQGLEERILTRFEQDPPDLIVYGHSHVPFFGTMKGVLMFNPGSASHHLGFEDCTVGMLKLIGTKFEAEIINVRPR
ncbi:MAG: metallophosphoesterase family protein [Desulfomonilaceae bacterium]